jgi:hypothetical protein
MCIIIVLRLPHHRESRGEVLEEVVTVSFGALAGLGEKGKEAEKREKKGVMRKTDPNYQELYKLAKKTAKPTSGFVPLEKPRKLARQADSSLSCYIHI